MLVGDLVTRYTADMLSYYAAIQGGIQANQRFVQSSQQTASQINQSFQGMNSGVSQAMGLFSRYLAPAALIAFGQRIIAVNDNLSDLADRTGFSAGTLSGLRTSLQNAGLSVDMFARGMQFAQRGLGDIDKSTDKTAVAINKLKLNVQDLQAMSPEEFFATVSKALSEVSNQSERMALQGAVFARAGTMMGNSLGDIGKNFAQLKDSGLNTETVRILGDLGDAMNTMKNRVMDLVAVDMVKWFRATAAEAQAFLAMIVPWLEKFIAFQEALPKFAFQQKMVDTLKSGMPALKGQLDEWGNSLKDFRTKHLDPWGGALDKWAEEQAARTAALGKGPGKGFVDEDALKKSEALTKNLQGQITTLTALAMEFDKGEQAANRFKVTEEALAALEGGKLTPAHKAQIEEILRLTDVTKGHETILKSRNEEMKRWIALIDDTQKSQKSLSDIEGKLRGEGAFGLSAETLESMKTELLGIVGSMEDAGTATDETRGKLNDLLKLIDDWAKNAAFREAIPSMLEGTNLALDDLQVRLKNVPKTVDPLLQTYEQLFDSIAGGMNSTVQGIMQGTQTIGEGFRRMGQNILLTLSQIIIQLGVLNPLKNALLGDTADFKALPTLAGVFSKLAGGLLGGGGDGLAFGDVSDLSAQHGGTVAGPRGRPIPILAHAGERIIPLKDSDKPGNGGVQVIIRGSIRPEPPSLSPREVIQIVANDFDNRGLTLLTAEQRMSPRR